MEGRRNITVSLDQETIRKAKVLAAKRGTSVTGLLSQTIRDLVGEEEVYSAAREKSLGYLKKGFHMGGGALPSRDKLHER